jgi:two-component system LytT family response regulator
MKAVIIDDEPYASQALVSLLKRYCPEVTIAAVCNNSKEAVQLLQETAPQLIFLDIEMPFLNGFELLELIAPVNFRIIFTTSYDQYAIKAIRFSALDYLLKPVDGDELKAAVKKATAQVSSGIDQQLALLMSRLQEPQSAVSRIALPTLDGLQMIPVNSIIYCTASSNYTLLTLKDKQKLLVSRTLKEIEEMLSDFRFLRVHHTYLVNLLEVKKYKRGEGGTLTMSDGSSVDVSRSRKDELLKMLQSGI